MPPVSQQRGLAPGGGAAEPAAFRPPALLGNRHAQSLLTQVPWRRYRVRAAAAALLKTSRAEILDCGDGIRLQGFSSRLEAGERGVVVLLHGWEGSADSTYMLSAGANLLAAGFSVFRLNFRDHGNTEGLNEGLFHSCRIDEVVAAVGRIRTLTEPRRFALVGHSLGGNFALRVAAKAPANHGIDRVIAVCPVLEPASTMQALDNGLWIYRRHFLKRWRLSLEEKAAAFPNLYRFGDLRRFTMLTEMTAFFVERFTEFESLENYLSGYAVTGDALSHLAVPSRIIFAADDPVIPVADLDAVSRDGSLELTLANRGGHCGFVDGLFRPTWIDREIVEDLARLDQAAVEL